MMSYGRDNGESPHHEELDDITRSSSQMGTRNKIYDANTPQVIGNKKKLDLDYHRAYFSRNGTGQKIPLKQKYSKASAHMEGGEAATPGRYPNSIKLYDNNPQNPSYNEPQHSMI